MTQDPTPISIPGPTATTIPVVTPSRVMVENVQPEIDAGRYPIKRTLGERVEVTADIYADGHDALSAVLRHRAESAHDWTEVPMQPLGNDLESAADRALDAGLLALMDRHPDRSRPGRAPRELRVTVERERARCGAWYEMFPRSCAPEPGRHGTFRDAEARLPYVAEMGF